MTETLLQQVVQIAAIASEVGCSKSVISRILHLYNVRKAAGLDRIMQRISMGNLYNTAVGSACQFSAEQGKDLSWHTVSRCLRVFALKAHSAVTKPLISRKTQKARLTFVQEQVVWTKEN